MSDKIGAQHLERKAVLYVRQSSNFQVLHNEESRKLQYAMRQRLESLGWNEIDVIDEDLGRSAAGTVERAGFDRMVADVCLGKVGAVAAREVSRFARNSREWQQLVEVCRVVDTLLIDQEMVYSPRLSNDRLLLGLKGSLNEYELDLLRQRSLEARYEMARRGELLVAAPTGYLKTEDQRLEKDPDARVRESIERVFRKCAELGSVRQTLLWFLDQGLSVPVRNSQGSLLWKRPAYGMLHRMLTHPAYGGAYAYGKTENKPQYEKGQAHCGRHRKQRDQWLALLPGRHEGYVSWEEFERLQVMISRNNHQAGPGAPRRGSALLAGLLHCRRCGRKLGVQYTGCNHDAPRYVCHRGYLDTGEAKCIGFGGIPVDRAVVEQVFRVIAPAAVESAVLAHEQEAKCQDDVLKALQRDLEAARYEAARAQKQYDAIDPDNRLVADELERRWNLALERVREVELRLGQHQHQQATVARVTAGEFQDIAADLEAVWNDPQGDVRLRKRMVRTLIQDVIADIDTEASEVVLTVHWKGGTHTELRVPRRRRGNAASTPKETVKAVRTLARLCPDDMIAGLLNRNGLRTGRGNRWTRERVTSMRAYHKIPACRQEERQQQGWLTLTESAKLLDVSTRTLRLAIERGEIAAEHPLGDGPWILHRDQLTTEAAQAISERARNRQRNPAVPSPNQKTLGF